MEKETQVRDNSVLIDFIRFCLHYRSWITKAVLISIFFAVAYSFLAEKQYRAHVTFYINEETSSENLGSYAKLLGINNSDPISGKLSSLMSSHRLQLAVSQNMYDVVSEKYQIKLENDTDLAARHAVVMGKLKIKKRFSYILKDTNFYQISMLHPDPQIAKLTVEAYLKALTQLNIELELSPKKELYTILDHPQLPINHSSPILKNVVLLGICLGLFFGSSVSFIHYKRHELHAIFNLD